LLAEWKKLDFGKFTTEDRDAPRGVDMPTIGRAAGATSSDMIDEGQVQGMAAQAAAHKISLGIIYIGSNDLSRAMRSKDPSRSLPAAVDRVMQNIEAAVETLRKAQPKLKIIIATVPDVSLLPHNKSEHGAGHLRRIRWIGQQCDERL